MYRFRTYQFLLIPSFLKIALLRASFFIVFVLFANTAFAIPKTILIYSGDGTAMTDGMEVLFKLTYPDAKVILADSRESFDRTLSAISHDLSDLVIVFPGGQMNAIAASLDFYPTGCESGEKIKKQIWDAVRGGASYLGVCAGAGLGCGGWISVSDGRPFLSFLQGPCSPTSVPGSVDGFSFLPKMGVTKAGFTTYVEDQGRLVSVRDPVSGKTMPFYWYMAPTLPFYGYYDKEFNFERDSSLGELAQPIEGKKTGIVKLKLGRGLVVLSLVHPEQAFCKRDSKDWEKYASEMCRQLAAMSPVDAANYKRGKIRFLAGLLKRSGEEVPHVPGFITIDVDHDGDCAFHAISISLKREITRRLFVEKLRSIIARIETFPQPLQEAIFNAAAEFGALEQWVTALEGGLWLGPGDLAVLALVEKIHLVVHTEIQIIADLNPDFAAPVVHIVYDAAHYLALAAEEPQVVAPAVVAPAVSVPLPAGVLVSPELIVPNPAPEDEWRDLRPLFSEFMNL